MVLIMCLWWLVGLWWCICWVDCIVWDLVLLCELC